MSYSKRPLEGRLGSLLDRSLDAVDGLLATEVRYIVVGWYLLTGALVRVYYGLQFDGVLTPEYDTFLYDNAYYNTIVGKGFFRRRPYHYDVARVHQYHDISQFASHNQPFDLLLVPLYWLVPSVYTLLFVQLFLIGVAAFPIKWVTHRLTDERTGTVVAIAYLFNPIVLFNVERFHPVTAAPLFVFLLLYCYQTDRFLAAVGALALLLSLKENTPLLVVPLLAVLLVDGYRFNYFASDPRRTLKYVLPGLVVAPLWLWASFQVVIPYFRRLEPGGASQYLHTNRYEAFGRSMSAVMRTIALHPTVVVPYLVSSKSYLYLLKLVAVTLGIPLHTPASTAVALGTTPLVLQNVLSNRPYQVLLEFQYQVPILALMLVGTCIAFRDMHDHHSPRTYRVVRGGYLLGSILATATLWHRPIYLTRLAVEHLL